MRVLKFKVWDRERKRMSLPFEIGDMVIKWEDGDIDMPLPFAKGKAETRKRFVFIQYVGIEDKNKLGIYEGDIVVSDWGYGFDGEKPKPREVEFEDILYWKQEGTISDNIEVIGNVHENPELMKG